MQITIAHQYSEVQTCHYGDRTHLHSTCYPIVEQRDQRICIALICGDPPGHEDAAAFWHSLVSNHLTLSGQNLLEQVVAGGSPVLAAFLGLTHIIVDYRNPAAITATFTTVGNCSLAITPRDGSDGYRHDGQLVGNPQVFRCEVRSDADVVLWGSYGFQPRTSQPPRSLGDLTRTDKLTKESLAIRLTDLLVPELNLLTPIRASTDGQL